jgi:hypothetical protein
MFCRNSFVHQLTKTEEKFTIDNVRFQDPTFTPEDCEFLRQRGYVVIDWDENVSIEPGNYGTELDPSISKFLSSSTLCFFPFLYIPALIPAMLIAKPNLYLGVDLVQYVALSDFRNPHVGEEEWENFEGLALSYDRSDIPTDRDAIVIDHQPFGFLWPADLTDQNTVDRLQEQNSAVVAKSVKISRHGRAELPGDETARKIRRATRVTAQYVKELIKKH